MAEERRIVELGPGDVDLVEGLWKELFGHHRELTGQIYPVRDPETSWQRRRSQYVEWLEAGEGHIFLAPGEGAEQAPLGYACLRVESSGPTWNLGDKVGDLESLSVTASARGLGVGGALTACCRARLAELGATWWTVTAITDNPRAVEFYEREGFRPFWLSMIAPIE
jgi:GNAT superfamily N-acetyltransferase